MDGDRLIKPLTNPAYLLTSLFILEMDPTDTLEQSTKKRCKRRAFTPEEDIKITQLVKLHGTGKWDIVASCLEGRNAKQCRERWRAFLSPGMVNGPWTREEDQLLMRLSLLLVHAGACR